jgi:hypothetical protein
LSDCVAVENPASKNLVTDWILKIGKTKSSNKAYKDFMDMLSQEGTRNLSNI